MEQRGASAKATVPERHFSSDALTLLIAGVGGYIMHPFFGWSIPSISTAGGGCCSSGAGA